MAGSKSDLPVSGALLFILFRDWVARNMEQIQDAHCFRMVPDVPGSPSTTECPNCPFVAYHPGGRVPPGILMDEPPEQPWFEINRGKQACPFSERADWFAADNAFDSWAGFIKRCPEKEGIWECFIDDLGRFFEATGRG